jgi:hypothetical protein
MSGQGNFEQAEKPTSTEAPKTSGTQHHPAEVNNMSGWATILALLAIRHPTPSGRSQQLDGLPIGWIGNRLARWAPDWLDWQPIGSIGSQYWLDWLDRQTILARLARWATILALLATILALWGPDLLPTGWIGNRSTQNIQGDYGRQANNFGTQNQPKYDFAPAPAPKTSGTQQQRHPKHPTTTAEVNNGNQNIQGDYGIQANNAGYQERPTFTFS